MHHHTPTTPHHSYQGKWATGGSDVFRMSNSELLDRMEMPSLPSLSLSKLLRSTDLTQIR